ncbi:protein trichome birefringence-like 4 [Ipomoea triloba]|uniref:protein trichome birefringence-like 4 n=1 Tax=Ipomoea triloba TaxID=35885 RepID=UPI00125CDB53|nr:protein trichome birefringence-like 4 [Ipomoea triloba]GMD89301.1 protein trichome birefringence-like 4 [Ipomoea batatas]GME20147.1 protein trichome birefringence-like 4 [Ipomoea batatas]
MESSRKLGSSHHSKSYATQGCFTLMILITSALFLFNFPASDQAASPSLTSTKILASNYISSLSSIVASKFLSGSCNCSTSQDEEEEEDVSSCDLFDGRWVEDDDDDFEPLYKPGSCPFIDDSFNCFKNGRPDSDYLRLRWKPSGCQLPRFDGLKMLKMLRGKRLVFVGDSLNRNMWESLVCSLRESLVNKSRLFEVSGHYEFKTQGYHSFMFKDFQCSIEFLKSPFLVQQRQFSDMAGVQRETLRLDKIQTSLTEYRDADIIIFNTGHWWTHQNTNKWNNYFQEGNHVFRSMAVADAYTKALKTWAKWVDANIKNHTRVFFRGYSASHFKGGQWNSGGSCDGETRPIRNESHLGPYPWMMRVLESVIAEMKTPVLYLNISRMTDYRKDGHPSIFKQAKRQRLPGMTQDCSHWCLPGVPDAWNELLYATLLISHPN